MDKKYQEFRLMDFPTNEFSVLLEPKLQKRLIKGTINNFGRWGAITKLAKHLKTSCKSFENVKWESINDRYIPLWKKCRMFIPIDCLIEVCKISKKNHEELKNFIKLIRYKVGRTNPIYFNFKYDIPFATISEIIKTEGHIKTNFHHITFSSEHTELINFVKNCLKNFRLSENDIYETLRVELDIPKDIVSIVGRNGKIKFRKFVRGNKNKASFIDKFNYGETKEYVILTKLSTEKLKIKIPKNSKIQTYYSYGHSGAVIHLTISNITFAKILCHLTNVPQGKKSKLIKIYPLLFSSPLSVKTSVISAVIACEGWVEKTSKRIRFYVESPEYIEGFKLLLENLGIKPHVDKNNFLSISSRKDLLIFSKSIDLIVQEKKEKLKEILATYKRYTFRLNEGLTNVLKLLQENAGLTAYQIAQKLNKHKDAAFFHINRGIKRGFISKNSQKMPFTYFLTSNGKEFLKKVGE